MTDEIPTRRSLKRDAEGESTRRRRHRWPWLLGGALVLLVVIGAGAWIGLKALTVKSELEAARPLLSTVKDKVLAGQAVDAQGDAAELAQHATAARDAASGPLWSLGEAIPVLGGNLVAVRTIAESVSEVVDDAVVPAVALGDSLSPAVFKPVDGAVNLGAVQSILPVLDRAGTALTGAKDAVGAIDTDGLLGPVADAVTQMNDLVVQVEPAIATAKEIAPVLPALLGADGPRNYLLVFENSAEARPLGGIAGAQILITADQGRISIAQQTSGRDFAFESEAFADSQVPKEARQLFLVPFGLQSQNNTLTPRVDVAAQLTRAMWQNQRGVTADTVVFIDPVALASLLKATGPLTLVDGTQLSSENAIDLLLNGVYQMFADSPDAQDAYFNAAAVQMFGAVMSGDVDIPALVDAVTTAGSERRILASSTDATVEELIVRAGLQGRMPAETENAHQIGIYLSDFLGSKMDYYLRTEMQVGQAQCTDGSRRLRVQVTAGNVLDPAAVPGLSIYITGGEKNSFRIPVGDLRVFTYVYAPEGSTILSISGSTSQADSLVGTDQAYPVARGVIQVSPGQSQTSTIDIDITGLPEKQIETLVAPMIVQPVVGELAFTC